MYGVQGRRPVGRPRTLEYMLIHVSINLCGLMQTCLSPLYFGIIKITLNDDVRIATDFSANRLLHIEQSDMKTLKFRYFQI